MDEAALESCLRAPAAKAPATQTFDLLAHAGWLLVANLRPEVRKAVYLDSFIGWHLINRDEMHVLSLAVAQSLVASSCTCLESQEYVIFSELRRVSWRQYVV